MAAFLSPDTFARIAANARKNMGYAKNAIMVLGYTFAPWMRSAIGKQVVTALVGALIGRGAEKAAAFALQRESERVSSGTIWSQSNPRRSVAIAGVLPVGTIVPAGGVAQTMRIGPIKIPMPIFFRALLPPKPWRFRTKAEVMAQFNRPKARTIDDGCGTRYVPTGAPGVFTLQAIPCA